MRQFPSLSRLSRFYLAACTLLLAGCTFVVTPDSAQPTPAAPEALVDAARRRVSDVELLGVITVPNDIVMFDTPVGGLSAIAYDSDRDLYYFLSDDRASNGPARIYQAAVDMSDGSLDEGDLSLTGMILLSDESGAPFAEGMIDPEGLVYTGESFYVASEGNASAEPPLAPAIFEFSPTGEYIASLPLPDRYIPLADGTRGVRNNQAFESLTRTPDGRYLISGVENALVQDGPAATLEDKSPSRLLTLDLASGSVVTEQVYEVEAIPAAPTPANGEADNGLAEVITLDNNGTLLAMERSYVQGVGNTIRLFMVNTREATNVSGMEALNGEAIDASVHKETLVDFGELGSTQGIKPDNLEGMVLGPKLTDGRQLLLVVSDNNFNPSQSTQLWALALTFGE